MAVIRTVRDMDTTTTASRGVSWGDNGVATR